MQPDNGLLVPATIPTHHQSGHQDSKVFGLNRDNYKMVVSADLTV